MNKREWQQYPSLHLVKSINPGPFSHLHICFLFLSERFVFDTKINPIRIEIDVPKSKTL